MIFRRAILMLAATRFALSADRICPIPTCRECLDPSLQKAPGFGFHLGLAGGTVSVSHGHGHMEDIVHVPGGPQYLALMQTFTTDIHRLDPPPLGTIADRLRYLRKMLRRRANLLSGRPGTPEAAILSDMLITLRQATEARQAIPQGDIGIALANAALVSHEELNDGLAHAGLRRLREHQVPDRELNAAYGASENGMCPTFADPYECEKEEDALGRGHLVLHIDYTQKALAANSHSISTARSTYATTKFTDWSLGRDSASVDEAEYWHKVTERLRLLFGNGQAYTMLLLTGNCADDEDFRHALKMALSTPQQDAIVSAVKTRDFTYNVARGVAEFQWRRQRGWTGCIQPKRCSEKTPLERVRTTMQHVFEL